MSDMQYFIDNLSSNRPNRIFNCTAAGTAVIVERWQNRSKKLEKA